MNKIENNQEFNNHQSYTLINWYEDKMSPPLMSLFPVWVELSKLIMPEYSIHPQRFLLRTDTNQQAMFVHADNPGKGESDLLAQHDPYATCCVIDYGLVTYFGDFEGGDVIYPFFDTEGNIRDKDLENYKINKDDECLSYKPENGDVVIHSAYHPYEHGVRTVTKGVRYAFATFAVKAEENPGTYYNYGTQEYMDQIGNIPLDQITEEDLDRWSKPLISNDNGQNIINKVSSNSYIK